MEMHGQLHTPGKGAAGTRWIVGWVGLRAGPDTVMKRKIPLSCPYRKLDLASH